MANKLISNRRPWEVKAKPAPIQSGRKEKSSFYSNAPWRKLRLAKLMSNPLCEECQKKGRITAAEMVDHIKPIRQGGEPLEWGNLQSLCDPCHNAKSGRERHA